MFRFDPGTAGGSGHLDSVGPSQPADHVHAPPRPASQVVEPAYFKGTDCLTRLYQP
jgi:hypothetical protein